MKTKRLKAVYSIKEMAEALDLSRARFYQLLAAGILPQPLYDIRSHRPFYTLELQDKCLQVKETCTGVNGQYILFYTPRKKPQSNAGKPIKNNGSQYQDLVDMLSGMKLEVSGKDIESAIKIVYPGGIQQLDQGIVIRELFRFFKQKSV